MMMYEAAAKCQQKLGQRASVIEQDTTWTRILLLASCGLAR
jgi:hypothetical protein